MQQHASAKLNLGLHITGKQPDGYHSLQSLVAFAGLADVLHCYAYIPPTPHQHTHPYPASRITLHTNAHVPLDTTFFEHNLIARAANALIQSRDIQRAHTIAPAHIYLDKYLPIGAGLGGGSSDAAATLRLLNTYWKFGHPPSQLQAIAATLGSDIAACVTPHTQWMSGTGNTLTSATIHAPLWAVVVYPHIHLSARRVYQTLEFNADTMSPLPDFGTFRAEDASSVLAYLRLLDNHLTSPAAACAPEISTVLDALNTLPNLCLSRMSGSGSACFGVFAHKQHAQHASELLAAMHRDWWIKPTPLTL